MGDDEDRKAQIAYESLIRFALDIPEGEKYEIFNAEVKLRSKQDYNYTYLEHEQVKHKPETYTNIMYYVWFFTQNVKFQWLWGINL